MHGSFLIFDKIEQYFPSGLLEIRTYFAIPTKALQTIVPEYVTGLTASYSLWEEFYIFDLLRED